MMDSLADSIQDFDRQSRIGPVDIYPHMMKITFAMVARSLFGARLKEEDIDLISLAISTVQEFMVRQTIQPYLNPWFAVSGELRRHEEMRARAFGVLRDYIQRRRKDAPGHDLLQILMDARYSDGEGMSDELVLSESMQLLVAGHETSSNGLSWLLYLLSTRPDYVDKVRQEFEAVLGERPMSYTDVPKFAFTTQVITGGAASLSPVLDGRPNGPRGRPRRRSRDTQGLNGGRVHLRRAPFGAVLGEPGEFRRATLLQSEREAAHALSHLPFGAGPRGCIGGNYAMLQILMILSVLLRKYDFSLVPGQTHRSAPHGDFAARARNPHDLHRGNPTRRRQPVRLFSLIFFS